MERVGVLVVAYGSRETAIVDAFARSNSYSVELYVADKQRNPFNLKVATKHVVVPDLSINEICRFAENNRERIDFSIVGPEKPILEGIRDLVEKKIGIPVICPTKKYAIEASKAKQRRLLEKVKPETNPLFKIFSPENYHGETDAKKAVFSWLDKLKNQAVVKPDRPAAGKGVGVWGDHFTTRELLFQHFLSNLKHGSVIIEEKVEGQESSYQAFCDGKHLVPLPDTRDYKRAFDEDKGPNTGGMGSYKDTGDVLPFLTREDREKETEIISKVFSDWRGADKEGLRGVPVYAAFMHTSSEPKILEINSRPGDPEIINVLPILKDDFIDVCYKILEGNLTRIDLEKAASVVTYKAPPSYAGYADAFPSLVKNEEANKPVDLTKAYELVKRFGDRIRVYPASLEQRGTETYALRSRAVCAVGVGSDIQEARSLSLKGLNAIKGGALWHRTDIAAEKHIEASKRHMLTLRSRP